MKLRWICLGIIVGLLAGCRSDAMELNARFDRSPGLAQGDRVLWEKEEAGRVSTITRKDGGYLVGLQVSRDLAHAFTEHSRAYIIADPIKPDANALEIRIAGRGGALLAEGATMPGIVPEQEAAASLRDELEKGLHSLERRLRKYGRDLEELPETESFQKLKRTLREWMSEMERAGDSAREKLEKKWLPRIQDELEELRKRLEKDEGAEPPPQDVDRVNT